MRKRLPVSVPVTAQCSEFLANDCVSSSRIETLFDLDSLISLQQSQLHMQNNVLWDITNLDSFELLLDNEAVRFAAEQHVS